MVEKSTIFSHFIEFMVYVLRFADERKMCSVVHYPAIESSNSDSLKSAPKTNLLKTSKSKTTSFDLNF